MIPIGVKDEIRNSEGKVIGYTLKTGRELDAELAERLKRGEKIVKVCYGCTYGYLQHLKRHGTPHFKSRRGDIAVILVDERYRHYGLLAGVSEWFYKLEENEKFTRQLLKQFGERIGLR